MERGSEATGPVAWFRRPIVEAALIAVLTLTINLAGNGRVSLWDRDEPRYAEATREMRARGDWIRPSFNGEPRNHKPVLIYWLMGLATAAAGDNTFGVRLVSALAGTGTVLLTWGLGRRLFGARAGLLAALVLATAPLMAIESKMSTIDATLALFLTGGQFLLWRLSRGPSTAAAFGFWTLMALAFLAKGPVGPALILVAGLVSAWWGGPTAFLGRLRWGIGLAWFLALVLPWYVAIGILTEGEFYRFAVGRQIVDRVASGMEQHGGFPGYYLVLTLGTFFPWSAFLPAALLMAWRRRREATELGFLLGWVVGPWIVLECVRTKLIHYYLPALPACALLVGWLIDRLAIEGATLRSLRLGRLGIGILLVLGVVVPLGLVGASALPTEPWPIPLPGLAKPLTIPTIPAPLRAPLLAIGLIAGAGLIAGIRPLLRGRTLAASRAFVVTWSAVLLLISGWLLPRMEPYRASRRVAEKLHEWAEREDARPLLASYQQPSVIYAFGEPIPVMKGYASLAEHLEAGGSYVCALMKEDFRVIAEEPLLEATVLETFGGFNIDKFRNETLKMARIRRKTEADAEAVASAPGGEQVEVK